jgi:hypothetical protein
LDDVQMMWLAGVQRRRDDRETPVGKNVSERLAQDRDCDCVCICETFLLCWQTALVALYLFDRDCYDDDRRWLSVAVIAKPMLNVSRFLHDWHPFEFGTLEIPNPMRILRSGVILCSCNFSQTNDGDGTRTDVGITARCKRDPMPRMCKIPNHHVWGKLCRRSVEVAGGRDDA